MAQEKLQIQPLEDEELQIEPLSLQENPNTPIKGPEPAKELGQAAMGPISKGWDWLNTSVFGIKAPPMERLFSPNVTMGDIQTAGAAGMTTPLSFAGELAGGIGLFKALRGLKKVAPIVEDIGKVAKEDEFIPELGIKPQFNPKGKIGMTGSAKPRLRINSDGTFLNLETGEIIAPNTKPIQPGESIALNRSRPEAPDYTIRVLNQAGDGKPGLSEQIQPSKIPSLGDTRSITYRGPDGKPIATARLIQDSNGTWMVEDFAADKSKGLLYGKAVKNVGQELQRLGITTPSGSVTPDALNLIKKSKSNIGGPPNKPPIEEPITAEMPSPDEPFDTRTIKPPSKTRQGYELSRGLMSVDLPFLTSAAFRQGSPLAGKVNWFKAFANNAKSFGSEAAYDAIMAENAANPIHVERAVLGPKGKPVTKSIADEIGLAQSNLKSLTQREEQIRSVLTEKIPVYGRYVRASNRGYTAFLNTLRTKTAEDWLRAGNLIDDKGNITNLVEAKKIANTVNELTGHGSLNVAAPFSRFTKSGRELSLEKAHDALSLVFFSPRLLARDARMMNPLNYVMTDKLIRMKYLEGAVRRAGVWASFTGLAKMAGAEVSDDITNSDFGKARIGDTRLDAGTGLLQWLVLAGREALGETTSSTSGKTKKLGSDAVTPSMTDLVTRFGINRLHPTLGLAAEAGNARATKGREFTVGSEIAERMLPMFTSDMMDLMKSDPELSQIMLGLLGAGASMGTMTYQGGKEDKPTFEIPGDIQFKGSFSTGSKGR